MDVLLPCLYAFLACGAFCIIFELRRWWYILSASVTGAVSWLVFLLLEGAMKDVGRYFVATIVVASLSEIFARVFKAPATLFLIVGIIPLVPGGGIYYTMDALIGGDMGLFFQRGMETVAYASAIAVGSSLVSSVVRILPVKGAKSAKRERPANPSGGATDGLS